MRRRGMAAFGAWVAAGLLLAAGAAGAAEPKATREVWEGSLKVTPDVSLRLVLNLTRTEGAATTATLDSPDQGATGLKVDTVSLDGGKLVFELKMLAARFEGTLNPAGDEAAGTWSQGGGTLPLTLKKGKAPEPVVAGKETVWEGKLSVGARAELRLVFRVNATASGQLVSVMDSPDQGAKGIKVDATTLDKERLVFELKALRAKFEGKLDAAGAEAVGEWTQGPAKFPLTLRKVAKATSLNRPQTPKPPFPYRSEDVTYENAPAKVKLAGTLTLPPGEGPFPAAILISGSGSQDRDETLFEHRPFLVLADALTRRGVAVLRVDDRGVGGSTGDAGKATTDDFAGDVLAGVAYLKGRAEIDPKRIGLIGHSEGGVIAPIAATRAPEEVAFIVLMAGTGLPGDQILRMQGRLIALAMGASESDVARSSELQDALIEIAKAETDPKAAEDRMKAAAEQIRKKLTDAEREAMDATKSALDAGFAALRTPWFRYFLTFDPRPTLRKVRCPVLAVVGEKDLQVPPKENLAEIAAALKAGGNPDATTLELPGLNHLFQTAKTGSTVEYAQIEETFAPAALRAIGDWVVERTKK